MVARIVIAIDGTGDSSKDKYDLEMKNSFVNRIYNRCKGDKHFRRACYHRGPALFGTECGRIADLAMVDYLTMLAQNRKSEPLEVYIVGYSRGAMIALYVANRIHQHNTQNFLTTGAASAMKRSLGYEADDAAKITIPSMILFDPVDSAATLSADTIAANVQRVDNFVCGETNTRFGRSRWWFNRIKLLTEGAATAVEMHTHHCTHSAIGGLPGQGDHFIPASGLEIVHSGVAMALESARFGVNPVAGFIAGSTGRAYHSMKSDITLEDDRKSAGPILRQLNNVLQQHWHIDGI